MDFIRNILNVMLTKVLLKEKNIMLEALNSDSIYNAIKFLRLRNAVSKEGIKVINLGKIKYYIQIIKKILIFD